MATEAAQRLLDHVRTEMFGDRLPVDLAGQAPEMRASLERDAAIAMGAVDTPSAAQALYREHHGDIVPLEQVHGAAGSWWWKRAAIVRGEVAVVPPPLYVPKDERGGHVPMKLGNAPCRKCGRTMRWVKSQATGKPFPVDPDPKPGYGNVLTDGNGLARVYADHAAALAARAEDIAAGGPLGITSAPLTSHHATCPPVVAEREAKAAEKRRAKLEAAGGEQIGLGL